MQPEARHWPYIRITIAVIIAASIIFYVIRPQSPAQPLPDITVSAMRVEDATFKVDGKDVDFINGVVAPDSLNKIDARFFGTPVLGDVSGDGVADAAVEFTYAAGGSGTFYYIAGAVKTDSGYVGSNAILLGDRIAPQTLEVQDGVIVANFADRNVGEPMTTVPSVGVTKYFKVTDGILIETKKPLLPSEGCVSMGGKFDAKYKECGGISASQCVGIGGVFNECASACRNNPKAKVCTLQCVQVCQFGR